MTSSYSIVFWLLLYLPCFWMDWRLPWNYAYTHFEEFYIWFKYFCGFFYVFFFNIKIIFDTFFVMTDPRLNTKIGPTFWRSKTEELHIPLKSWSLYRFSHRLSKITDSTLDVVFSRFRSISFTITLREKPNGVTRIIWVKQALSLSCNSTEREPVLRQLRVNPVGFCFKVIVNEILLNLEKTTSTGIFFYFTE